MRIRWRGLELPNQVIRDEHVSTEDYGKFIIEPFERGFGITIGNSLRRILLSSLEGASVTKVKIAEATHEFTSLPGVLEDITDIVLNIKGLVLDLKSDGPRKMSVQRSGTGPVTAADIVADPNIVIINKDHHLATLTTDVPFSIEMWVDKGRGWRPADENQCSESEIGVFPVDSSFSPVRRVRYKTEETRVGQKVNYDRLILEIWTNGAVKPEDALVEAAKILRKHLNPFLLYQELGQEVVTEPLTPAVEPEAESDIDEELQAKLNMRIADLSLSVRANNCLDSARILTVGQLANCTESDLLRMRSFGKTSLREVKRKLQEMGLSLGMNVGPFEVSAVGMASAPKSVVTDPIGSILPAAPFGLSSLGSNKFNPATPPSGETQ